MAAILIFVGAVIWGSLSAQFLVQAMLSFAIALICLAGIVFSKVSKTQNIIGALTSLVQSIIFGILFLGGNYLSSDYINYETWGAASIVSVISFLLTIVYCSSQIHGRIRLARLCSWVPYFFEASNRVPCNERVAFAKKYQAGPPVNG